MSGNPGADAAEVLADLPVSLCGELLGAFRRAADRFARAELPSRVRPYAGWKPDRLLADRPRRAIGTALAMDPELREAVATELGGDDLLAEAMDAPLDRLVDAVGEQLAAALLAAADRWSVLATLAGEVAERESVAAAVAAEGPPEPSGKPDAEAAQLRRELAAAERQVQQLNRALRDAEREAQELRERAAATEDDSRQRERENERLQTRITALGERVDDLEQELIQERTRTRERLARMRRRVGEAESQVRAEAERARLLEQELAASDAAGGQQAPAEELDSQAGGRKVPRNVSPATPGRPARLPPGLVPDSAQGVRALLQVPGLRLVVDGYNVTKSPAGQPAALPQEQRSWLVGLLQGVVSRHRVRAVAVFDGSDVTEPVPSRRGVQVLFSSPGETADDRIIDVVRDLPEDVPVLVVSSDREVQEGVIAADANCCRAEAFLSALRT